MKNLKTFISLFAIASMTVTSLHVSAQASKAPKDKVLDKKVYTLELLEQGKKNPKAIADEISFMNNKLKSKAMGEYDFSTPAAYTVTVDSSATPPTISFEAEAKNGSDETLKWSGTITDENIEGTASITNKKGKVKKEFNYTGTLKSKKKK